MTQNDKLFKCFKFKGILVYCNDFVVKASLFTLSNFRYLITI